MSLIFPKFLTFIGIGDVWDVPVGVGDGDVPCVPSVANTVFTKFLMFIGIGDVRDVPVGVGGGDVICVPIKQCRNNIN